MASFQGQAYNISTRSVGLHELGKPADTARSTKSTLCPQNAVITLANSLPVCASKPTRHSIKNAWWTLESAMKIGGGNSNKVGCGQDKRVTPILTSSAVQLALVLCDALNKSRIYLKKLSNLNASAKRRHRQ